MSYTLLYLYIPNILFNMDIRDGYIVLILGRNIFLPKVVVISVSVHFFIWFIICLDGFCDIYILGSVKPLMTPLVFVFNPVFLVVTCVCTAGAVSGSVTWQRLWSNTSSQGNSHSQPMDLLVGRGAHSKFRPSSRGSQLPFQVSSKHGTQPQDWPQVCG